MQCVETTLGFILGFISYHSVSRASGITLAPGNSESHVTLSNRIRPPYGARHRNTRTYIDRPANVPESSWPTIRCANYKLRCHRFHRPIQIRVSSMTMTTPLQKIRSVATTEHNAHNVQTLAADPMSADLCHSYVFFPFTHLSPFSPFSSPIRSLDLRPQALSPPLPSPPYIQAPAFSTR